MITLKQPSMALNADDVPGPDYHMPVEQKVHDPFHHDDRGTGKGIPETRVRERGSQFSVSSGGDLPMEAMSLNFTKITTTFTPMGPSVSGNNKVVSYDLTTMTGSAS